jgi:hypothetical protein
VPLQVLNAAEGSGALVAVISVPLRSRHLEDRCGYGEAMMRWLRSIAFDNSVACAMPKLPRELPWKIVSKDARMDEARHILKHKVGSKERGLISMGRAGKCGVTGHELRAG